MMGDISEDPYHHWLFADYFASIGVYSDPFGATWIFLPGYHVMASSILFLLGRDIIWLKLVNILFSLGGIYLVYLIAGKHSWIAGVLAATFLALNPFEILPHQRHIQSRLLFFSFFLQFIFSISGGKRPQAWLF